MTRWRHLFISYAHADQRIALRIAKALEDSGIEIWIDEDIEGGRQWSAEIARAIEGKSQKVNRFRTPPASFGRMSLGKSSKFDQPGLGWFQCKSKLPQPLMQRFLNTEGIRTVLEAYVDPHTGWV